MWLSQKRSWKRGICLIIILIFTQWKFRFVHTVRDYNVYRDKCFVIFNTVVPTGIFR